MRQNSVTPSGFTRSSAALHARQDLDLGVKNASMAHHLARRAKREKEHPMCGAAPLSPQFGAKVQKKMFSNKFQGRKVEIGYYISIFKEKGLPQDLIDEEQVSILSNQEAVGKYQKVIEDLEGEIQKLKEA